MYRYITALLILFILFLGLKETLPAKSLFSFFWGADTQTLEDSWDFYKKKFISSDGRVIDYQRDDITTSEGQAYAMRRALMMKDQNTFQKVYDWTKKNLKRKQDNLFAWKWGKKDGEYGLLDENTASDADIEIAATLLSASRVWRDPRYVPDAKKIIRDIWNKETVEINGLRVLVSGAVQAEDPKKIEVNPSYFMPDSFRLFERADRDHDWKKVIDSSYQLVDYCIDNLESGLPPDWFYIDRNTGEISFEEKKSDFSYDAIRVFYRFYLDYKLYKEKRAEKLLSKSKIFINDWQKNNKIHTEYKQNGQPKNDSELVGFTAILVPVIRLYNENIADEIYKNRVENTYHKAGYWDDPINYYTQNLAWFGSWLYIDENNLKTFKY